MDCKRARLILPAYFEKRVDQRDKINIELHLKSCAGCADAFAGIEKLSNALKAVSGILLPYSLAGELDIEISRSRTKRLATKVSRSFIIKRRALLAYIVNMLYISALVAFVLLAIRFDIRRMSIPALFPTSKKESVSQNLGEKGKQPLLKLSKNSKRKKEEPGVESLAVKPGRSSTLGGMLKPEVVISSNRYTKDDIGDVVAKGIVLDFGSEYTIGRVGDVKDKLISEISNHVQDLGEDGSAVKECINSLLVKLNKPALPAYIEKAYFKNREVWLIVLTWNVGEPSKHLSNVSVYAVDPRQGDVVYTE